MTYDEKTKTLTADAGKEIVRTSDGTRYGSSVGLGLCWVVGGEVLAEPHEDTPADFHEEDAQATTQDALTAQDAQATAKGRKLAEIEAYDASEAVNSFYVNGKAAWLDNAARTSYTASVQNARLLGEETVTLRLAGREITLPIDTAAVTLARISRYADQCWLVTERHKAEVEAMESDAEVEAYDITQGYPARLELTV